MKLERSSQLEETEKRVPILRLFFWLLLLAVLCAFYPPFFQFGVHHLAEFTAKRNGLRLVIGQVDGSLLEPVSFIDARLSSDSFAGSEIHLHIARAEASFSVNNLLFNHGIGWLKKLVIDGMDGEAIASRDSSDDEHAAEDKPIPARYLPASIQARRVNLAFHEKGNLIFFQNIECSASDVDTGTVHVEKIHIAEPGFEKTFSGVKGTMALQNSAIAIGSVVLEKGMRLEKATVHIPELLNRKLKMDCELSAFGGSILADIRGFTHENQHLNFQANGLFSRISIPELAAFLHSTDTTGGIIQQGKFAFYGSLRDLDKATLSTRFAATDFQWGNRRWNSLILGATLVNRRLQIAEFELQQAHNTLSLKGETAIPTHGANWLKTDFDFNIAAQIDNLSDLSVLFGPDFAKTAGKAVVAGSIKCESGSYTGELTVSGTNLSYGSIPLDTLSAAVKLNGNELQATRFEFVRQNDYLRGQGGVSFSGEKRYWGEIKASIGDLAFYSAILQPPVVPQSFAGGLVLDWSGDGTARAHSGAFHAQFSKIRPLVESLPKSIPLNADLEGTYSPEAVFFSKFSLSDTTVSVTAAVAASPKSLSLEGLQLKHENEVRLVADIVLPFNLWRAWRKLDAECWNSAGECKLTFIAKKLDLAETLLLSGRVIPVKGELQGSGTAIGTLADLSATGQLQYSKGELTPAPGITLQEISATLAGKDIKVEKMQGRFHGADFLASGIINAANRTNPELMLLVQSKGVGFQPCPGLKIKTDLDLSVNGPFQSAHVTGAAQITSAEYTGKIDLFSFFLLEQQPGEFRTGPPFLITEAPYARWQFDVDCSSSQPLKPADKLGTVWPDLHVHGDGESPRLTGALAFEGLSFPSPFSTVNVGDATVCLSNDNTQPAAISARFSAKTADREITGFLHGTLDEKQWFLFSTPPADDQALRQLLTRGFAPKSQEAAIPLFLESLPFTYDSPFLSDEKEWFYRLPPGPPPVIPESPAPSGEPQPSAQPN